MHLKPKKKKKSGGTHKRTLKDRTVKAGNTSVTRLYTVDLPVTNNLDKV